MERSALSASMVPVEKPVKRIGVVAKVTTEIRSFWSLRAMNVSAASTASESGSPSIDLERSTARTTLLAPPRLVAVTSSTRFPFSVTAGGVSDRSSPTNVRRTCGYMLVSAWRSVAATAPPGRTSAATAPSAARALVRITRGHPGS
jgi:hypothetical protein